MFYKRKLGKITLFLEAYYLPYIEDEEDLEWLDEYIDDMPLDTALRLDIAPIEGELVYLIEDTESYGVDNVGTTPGDLYLVVMGNRLLTLKSTWFERNFIPLGE